MWQVRSSLPNKSCVTAFGVHDSYGTVKQLIDCDGRDTDRAELLSKVPNSTNLTLHLTPDMVNVTCRSTKGSPAGKICPIAFKGKLSRSRGLGVFIDRLVFYSFWQFLLFAINFVALKHYCLFRCNLFTP